MWTKRFHVGWDKHLALQPKPCDMSCFPTTFAVSLCALSTPGTPHVPRAVAGQGLPPFAAGLVDIQLARAVEISCVCIFCYGLAPLYLGHGGKERSYLPFPASLRREIKTTSALFSPVCLPALQRANKGTAWLGIRSLVPPQPCRAVFGSSQRSAVQSEAP